MTQGKSGTNWGADRLGLAITRPWKSHRIPTSALRFSETMVQGIPGLRLYIYFFRAIYSPFIPQGFPRTKLEQSANI